MLSTKKQAATTAVCRHCGERFPLSRRDTTYCSPRCKQAAYRARNRVTAPEWRGGVTGALKSPEGTPGGVFPFIRNKPQKEPHKVGGISIVPDDRWPGMYRIRKPDGSLTDIVNLARARDAIAQLTKPR
jgi:hypothetical protein